MSTFERSERLAAQLPDLLVEIAAPRVPDYTDDVLAVTAAIRQRPRWTFPERWLPMIIANRRLALPAIPWRFVTALLAILAIVAATLLIAGSRPHLPPPFGPARNGAIAFETSRSGAEFKLLAISLMRLLNEFAYLGAERFFKRNFIGRYYGD